MNKNKRNREKKTDENTVHTERVIDISRTTKTTSGGKKMGFRALVVVGNGDGKVGFGIGKAAEVIIAIKKATDSAKAMMNDQKSAIPLSDSTIHYDTVYDFSATKVFIKPGAEGTGIIAGEAMRGVFEVAGIENVVGKVYKSTNKINVVQATVKALHEMSSPADIAKRRGLSVDQLFNVAEANDDK